jgi:hypothetical protein
MENVLHFINLMQYVTAQNVFCARVKPRFKEIRGTEIMSWVA